MQDISVIVFALAGLLTLVSLLPPLANQLNVPFTVLLAVVGTTLGIMIRLAEDSGDLGGVGVFLHSLAEINPSAESFLVIFLPVLVFEAALSLDVRRLLDDIAPILMLAVVAVLVSTLIVGFAVWPFSGVPLVGCLLLGAILATTDPSAVIGIFRDLGAPRRLTLLVAGESLLNDAAAIMLFSLLLSMVTGARPPGVIEGIEAFLGGLVGAVVVGYGMGRLLCHLVTQLHDLPLSEISLTVSFAYISYIVADYYCGVSGVVSVVVTALVVGSVGRTRVSPATWGDLELTWRQLGFWASSMIFLLAAMLVPQVLSRVSFKESVLLLVVTTAALTARAMVLYGLLPVLSLLGLAQRISPTHSAVILWGGLRGAVSLTLALAVTEHTEVSPMIRHFIAVLAPGYVLLTLFVHGTTLRPLIRLLGLDQLSPAELAMRNRALALSLSSVIEQVEGLARNTLVDANVASRTIKQYQERLAAIGRALAETPPLSEDDRLYIGLVILVNREEELYLQHFKTGIISRPVVETLTKHCSLLLDATKSLGITGYHNASRETLDFTKHMLWALRLQRHLNLRGPLARRLSLRFEALLISRAVLITLEDLNRLKLSPLLGEITATELGKALMQRRDLVEQALAALKSHYPNHTPVVEYQYLKRAALRMEETEYSLMHEESIINQEILNDLQQDVTRRRQLVERSPQLDLGLQLPSLIARVPIFNDVTGDRLAVIARLLSPRLALPDEVLVRRGESGDSMYFIASGSVEIVKSGQSAPIHLGPGDFFGEMALLSGAPRTANARAIGYCHLLELKEPDFRQLIDQDEELRQHIMSVAVERGAAVESGVAVESGAATN
ncbi:MAG: cation:proton antiporter [Rhodospirillaceae bacterium]